MHTHIPPAFEMSTLKWVAQFYKYLICKSILLALTTSLYLFSTWEFFSLGFHNTNGERSLKIGIFPISTKKFVRFKFFPSIKK